jgi:ankyrin repeat protein
MSFFSKLFGKDKKKEDSSDDKQFQWIEASENPWGIRVLDLRPFTQTMLSSSLDPQMATNAISYGGEDGTFFWKQEPKNQKTITCNFSFNIDKSLQPGVLFIPETMEHKWAIYFDGENLIFVRSWLREVFVTAKTAQKDNKLIVSSIKGEFTENESPEFKISILRFLLISHSIGEIVPAPLPKELEDQHNILGNWAFSTYGNMVHVGLFDYDYEPNIQKPLRSHSLLHIAVAKGDINEIEQQIKNGADINSLAGDGLATLHWSIANDKTEIMEKLIKMGADPNVTTIEGATPIMNAVQSNKINHLNILLKAGALVNFTDNRGFTALHRASEMGHEQIVKILLNNGADKLIVAENHTALTLAKMRENQNIINLLS